MCTSVDDLQRIDNCTSPGESSRTRANGREDQADKIPEKAQIYCWPEDAVFRRKWNWFQRQYQSWTYSYMRPILRQGAHQNDERRLTQKDLFPVPENMKSVQLAQLFQKHYYDEAAAACGDVGDEQCRSCPPTRQLLRTLWRLAAPTFVPAGFCQLLTVLCQVALPLLVRELLKVIESNPNEQVMAEGLPFAIAIFLVAFLNTFGNHRHRHLALKSGIVMRAATINILYSRVLRLTPKGKSGLTSGEVTNLIATDTQKLYEVAQEGHLVWALPLAIILVTICLLVVMGPTTLVGIAVLILFVPIVERITARMLAIRHQRVKMTDARVAIVSGMLQGIKVTKLNCYEEKYKKRVLEARDMELDHLRKELAVWALTLVIIVVSPIIATAATFAVYVLIDESNILTASMSFSVLLLFSALRFPINFAGRLLGKATQAYSAAKRIATFLTREVRTDEFGPIGISAERSIGTAPLVLKNALFNIDERSGPPAFRSADTIRVERGQVVAVCGPVGGGKSSLINGIIHEIPVSAETIVEVEGRVAYVGQTAFILNDTLRENILFRREFDRELYDRVIDACCLRADIEMLPAKDMTMIGERGVTLSGGQKQRVSLARAAYSQPDLALLDDPLSALDANTAKIVFERLIRGPDAVFSDTAVLLVTHAAHFLSQVDNVMVVVDGESKFFGTWSSLASFETRDARTKGAVDFIKSSVQEGAQEESKSRESDSALENTLRDGQGVSDTLMTVEEREHGLSSLTTWLLWFKHAGGLFFLLTQILFMAIDRFAYVAVEYWIARWTSAADSPITVFGLTFPAQTDGLSAQCEYLTVYSGIIFISICATVARSEWGVTGGWRAAKNLFANMLLRVLGAPLCSYFEATPLGRILNRFTYDIEVVDVTLTQTMSMFLISCSWYVAGVCVMVSILPWIMLGIVPVTIVYWMLLRYYRQTGNDLQRLDAVSRSPVQSMVSEAMDGAASIRTFRQTNCFTERFYKAVDQNSSALLCFVSAQRWLAFRIEILGSLIVLISSVLVISMNDSLGIDAGLAGLLILWSSNFTITLGFLVDTFSETEASITATERVDAMSRVPQEQSMQTSEKHSPPPCWPMAGNLVFDDVHLRYRKSLPLALNGLSFNISAASKVGVVGRTGAGKSSLTVALFRLVEIESGKITLDGIDLASLGLADVRGRPHGLSIIPQDPFLVGSTLRECIDPFSQASDDAIIEALKSVRIADEGSTSKLLDNAVAEGGSNFSVGERQLLNLARALLSKPKILVLDEATSSIDGETDSLIQQMLRTKFSETTLITVAHRLHTIIDFETVIVMEAGRAVEIGSPKELLDRNGVFAELVDATGPEGSSALRALAR